VHPTGRNYPTWECATQVNKPDNPNYQRTRANDAIAAGSF
jgi:hypothetical protein